MHENTFVIERALMSVTDKRELNRLAEILFVNGAELIASGGTAKYLDQCRLPVTDLAKHTGSPEMFGGRVKTLHPKIHGGILMQPDIPEHQADAQKFGIKPIQLVVCNLYRFEDAIRAGKTNDELTEEIDIGGVALIRAAAKNYKHVIVLTDPNDYTLFINLLRGNNLTLSHRQKFAADAWNMIERYDRAINEWANHVNVKPSPGQPSAYS